MNIPINVGNFLKNVKKYLVFFTYVTKRFRITCLVTKVIIQNK
nr:MAG TPA: hypothetical protein [Caudoviricetes sp.]